MRLLVLGGSEFVSEAVSKHLISKGYIVDILTRGIKSLSYDGYNKHIKCDRKDSNNMKIQLNEELYDYIFDISAYTEDALLFGRSGSQLQSNPFFV
jgi:nucleoside-diphosphate-sugar epimerase